MAAFDSFNIGKDIVIDITMNDGTSLVLPITVTGFHMKAVYGKIKGSYMDGVNRQRSVPQGWEGDIKLDRRDNTVDAFFSARDAAFYAGQTVQSAKITETTYESNGSLSQFQYTGVDLTFDDAGDKKADAKVEQTIGVFASKRKQIS